MQNATPLAGSGVLTGSGFDKQDLLLGALNQTAAEADSIGCGASSKHRVA